ncbi:alpha/beta hydrolase [Nocardia sp. NPDC101769]|uniref:alpha/beta hydrolase n=1 Tax=Nocardia sp. NPDC101769 TaxID=3364333 RepID=UPI00381D3AEF
MSLHPKLQAIRVRRIRDQSPPLYTLTVPQARAADLAALRSTSGKPEPVDRTIERTIPGPGGELTVRIYLPQSTDSPLPVLLYFFGGGWTLGSLETSDPVCRTLTNLVGCATVSVNYRLAPEHKFPAAVLDCRAATTWVREHATEFGADPTRIAVAGDSAGGNLAAAMTRMARDEGGPELLAQVLIYPNTAYGYDARSMRDNTDPSFFNRDSVDWYWRHYLPQPSDGSHPLASPLLAADHNDLPQALIITAEYDPLRDEGEDYAMALTAAGVPVTLRRFDGMTHGFFTMTGELEDAQMAVATVARYLHTVFGNRLDTRSVVTA